MRHQPNISRDAAHLIQDLMDSANQTYDYGDAYPDLKNNQCYASEFGGYAAVFAALNINILSVSYEPTPSPRRLYTTDVPQSTDSYTLVKEWTGQRPNKDNTPSSDESSEKLFFDATSPHVTFLIEFKVRVTSSDYNTQLRWVKFPATVPADTLDDTPELVYGQIIDQVLQARVMLQTPSVWASLTRLERGE